MAAANFQQTGHDPNEMDYVLGSSSISRRTTKAIAGKPLMSEAVEKSATHGVTSAAAKA
jgi:hypothetical protein